MTAAALTPNPSPQTGEVGPARELLAFLRAAGFAVTSEGDRVYVRPREKLSPAECGQIVALKVGLLAVLADERWTRCDPAEGCGGWVDPALAGELPFGTCLAKCPFRRKPRWRRKSS